MHGTSSACAASTAEPRCRTNVSPGRRSSSAGTTSSGTCPSVRVCLSARGLYKRGKTARAPAGPADRVSYQGEINMAGMAILGARLSFPFISAVLSVNRRARRLFICTNEDSLRFGNFFPRYAKGKSRSRVDFRLSTTDTFLPLTSPCHVRTTWDLRIHVSRIVNRPAEIAPPRHGEST